MRPHRRLLVLPLLLVSLAACSARAPQAAPGDAAAVLALGDAAALHRQAVDELLRRQLEHAPAPGVSAAALAQAWHETLPWTDAEPRLAARLQSLYSAEELAALRHLLESPGGPRLAGHGVLLNRELAQVLVQLARERAGTLEQQRESLQNAIAAGRTGTLSAEEDFAAVRAQAGAGDAAAALLLAEKLLAGHGTARDIPAAVSWLQRSAAAGHAPAQDLLAALHYRGLGMPADYRRARELLEQAAAQHYVTAVNNLAWLLATCPDDSLRDGARAVALLTPFLDQSPDMLDTLAAAHAEAGDYGEARRLQRQALERLGTLAGPRAQGFLDRLESYAAGRPWRDPATAPR